MYAPAAAKVDREGVTASLPPPLSEDRWESTAIGNLDPYGPHSERHRRQPLQVGTRQSRRWRRPRPPICRTLAGREKPGQRCSGRAQTPASVGQGRALHQSGELLSIQACAVRLPNGPSSDDDLRRYVSPGRGWFRGGGASGSHRPRAPSRSQGYPACPQVTENEGLNVTK